MTVSETQKKTIEPSQDKALKDDKILPEKKPFVKPQNPFNNNPLFNKPWYGWWKFGWGRSGWGHPVIRKHAARSR